MSIKNAVSKTIAYAKRNGVKAAFFAAVERVGDNRRENYNYVPLSDAVIAEQKKEYKLLAESGDIVRFSIVVPLYNTPEKYLREMIESVIAQTYGNWELVLADASKEPLDAAKEFAAKDPRICYYHLDSNEGISENTNCGLKKATGDYIGLLDHDDVLTPDALYEVDRVIRKSMKTNKLARFASCPVRLIYSDEDKYDDASGRYYEHHEKPSFNMDYLMSNNYICHFTVMRADVIKRLKFRRDYDGAQDYDLFLRACAEAALNMPLAANQIAHVDKVLYHWRCHDASTAANPASKNYAYDAGRRALQDLVDSYNIKATAVQLKHVGFYRLDYGRDFFYQRRDVGCVGGKIVNKRGRICGGMYRKDESLVYAGLPEEFSGGLQHRAVLQQDAYAVDVRCIAVREELIPVYQEITGVEYHNSFDGSRKYVVTTAAETEQAILDALAGGFSNDFDKYTDEAIVAMSIRFANEVRKRGYRIMWDPQVVKRVKA